jgi:hypothetical protein
MTAQELLEKATDKASGKWLNVVLRETLGPAQSKESSMPSRAIDK